MTTDADINNTPQRLTLTIASTAAILGCSEALLYKQASQLPFVLKLGKRLIVSQCLLEKYLAGGYGEAINER